MCELDVIYILLLSSVITVITLAILHQQILNINGDC